MNAKPAETYADGVDIVALIVREFLAAGVPAAVAQAIEQRARDEYGGRALHIYKRRRHLTAAEREEVFAAAIAGVPDAEILTKHRISLRTLDRAVKKGGGGGGRRFG